MGPKRRGRRKGRRKRRGKKKKKALKKIEREHYEMTVQTLRETLRQRDELVKELERLKNQYKSRYDQEVIDRNDVFQCLQREIDDKTNAIETVQEDIAKLEKLRILDKEKWQERVKAMKVIQARTIEQLQLENEALGDKLSGFEEYRVQKQKIDAEIRDLEMQLAEKSLEYENELYRIEKHGIIDHDRLRKDMHKQVEDCIIACQQFSENHMQETVKRAIKEAVKMGIELKRAGEMAYLLSEENQELKKIEQQRRNELKIEKACENEMAWRYQCRHDELKQLRRLFQKHTKYQEQRDELEKRHQELSKSVEEQRKFIETYEFNVVCFIEKVKELTRQQEVNKSEIENGIKVIDNMSEAIHLYIKSIKEATEEITDDVNIIEYTGKRKMVLLQLLDIMDKAGEMGNIDYKELILEQSAFNAPVYATTEDIQTFPSTEDSLPSTVSTSQSDTIKDLEEIVAADEDPKILIKKEEIVSDLHVACQTILGDMGLSTKFQHLSNMMKEFR